MHYRFTHHFWEKWQEREAFFKKHQITPEKIVEFTFNPDKVLPDDVFPNREWRLKKVGNRCLKIVVEPEGDILVIITAYFDRTLKRKGLCE
jgi:hypothetical protein